MARKYPAVILLIPVLIGIVASDLFSLSPYPPLILGAISVLIGIWQVGRGRQTWAAVTFCVTVASLAAFHFGLRYVHHGPDHISSILSEPIPADIYGKVADWPELKPGRTEIIIALDSLVPAGEVKPRTASGSVLLQVTDTSTFLQRGDRVSLRARLYPIPDARRPGFDYGRYLRLHEVGAIAYLPTLLTVRVDRRAETGPVAIIDQVRDAITRSIDKNLSPVSAALAKGFLIGETRDIPPELYGRFRDSGTLHLLAVSGSNVALVLLFVIWAMRPFRLGRPARNIALLLVIGLFAGLSYGDPSVVRASIMAVFVLGARLLGRPVNLNNTIALTALVVLTVDPAQLYDVGFQLSFVTAWGLIFVTPLVSDRMSQSAGKLWFRWLVLPLLITLIAQVVSAPIIAYYFGRLPLHGVLANLVIIPMVSIAVFGLMIMLLANLILPILGALAGSLLDLWLVGTVRLIEWMGGLDSAIWTVPTWFRPPWGVWSVLTSYTLVVLLTLSLERRAARKWLVIVTIVAANAVLAMTVVESFKAASVQIIAEGIQGGVAVTIRPGGSDHGDLIISDLKPRDYGLDSTVIKTLLEERGLSRLDRLALLSPQYGVVDDLLRAAKTYRAERLLLPSALKATADDWLAPHDESRPSEVDFFGLHSAPERVSDGIHLVAGRADIRVHGLQAVVIDRIEDLIPLQPDSSVSSVLIIGQTWQPAANDWLRLHRAGWDLVVCSEIEQQTAGDSLDPEFDPDHQLPEYLIDLSRVGRWRFEVHRSR